MLFRMPLLPPGVSDSNLDDKQTDSPIAFSSYVLVKRISLEEFDIFINNINKTSRAIAN